MAVVGSLKGNGPELRRLRAVLREVRKNNPDGPEGRLNLSRYAGFPEKPCNVAKSGSD